MEASISIYIHIPFCMSKCLYCDFNSFSGLDNLIESYFYALEKEIIYYSFAAKGKNVKTVFIGGGTPSYVDARYMSSTLNHLKDNFKINKDAEISIESNPGTLDRIKLGEYVNAGFNRLSIGLQSTHEHLLETLGRKHRTEDFLKSVNTARQEGLQNNNVDLIFGIPGQTLSQWEDTIKYIIALNIEHISCYSLKIEKGTPFYEALGKKAIVAVSDEIDREMYHMAVKMLCENGYEHYEISNFAREGSRCMHNIAYWKCEEYIGMGAGAHSFYNNKRFNNVNNVREYILRMEKDKSPPVENILNIDFEESMSEYMIMGLRKADGISEKSFKKRFDVALFSVYEDEINKLLKKGFLQKTDKGFKLSYSGLDLANKVFIEFI